jgi:hypothetical protein
VGARAPYKAHNGPVRHARHFTLEEARVQLPWVESKLAALRDARARLTDQQARQALADGSPTNGGGQPGKVVGEAFVELQNGIAAFDHRGIVLRDLDSGLIDFPSIRDGQEIYLCWIDGETDIGFWHELDAGYAGRQPL